MACDLREKGSWEVQASRLPYSLDNGKDAFLTVIVRLVLNRSSECSEEAVKELDEVPIVYCLRSALNKQKAFGGPSTGLGRTECWIIPFTTRGVLDFPVRGEQRYVRQPDRIEVSNFGAKASKIDLT